MHDNGPVTDVELSTDQLLERLAPVGVVTVRRLAGGASSLTYLATGPTDRSMVVKVAPAGVPPVLHRDVLRQARVLRALAGTAVPVPEVLWEDPGAPPDDPPLFVMAHCAGTSSEPLFDVPGTDGADAPSVVAERLRQATRVLVALHQVDPAAVGLGDEPVVGPADEVARWCRLLATVDPPLAPRWPEVADALLASVPEPMGPAVVHGDFRLGNLLAVGSSITAVIDWEIWTVGDPRVDLGWLLVNADPATYERPSPYRGLLPDPAELAAIHGADRDVAWFEALACFKSTATWSLIAKHNRRRRQPDPAIEAVAADLPRLLARATDHLRAADR